MIKQAFQLHFVRGRKKPL